MIIDVKILQTDILSDSKYLLKNVTYEYSKDDGSKHQQIWEVYDRGGAAVILLYNKDKKTVILTQQFRLTTFINGNKTGMLIEACAGMLDGDTPEACAIRETEEETGYKITAVQKIFEAYMSPGSLTEKLYFFVAEYNNALKVSEGGGLAEEQENIEVLELHIDTALQMINSGEIEDAKTIMLLQYAKLNGIL